MKNLFSTIPLIVITLLCVTFIFSCSKQEIPTDLGTPAETQDPRNPAEVNDPPDQEGILLSNPNAEQIMSFKHGVLEMLIDDSFNDGISLVLGEVPSGDGYQTMMDTGILPIIPSNRYTGEDIKITKEYSPGDIYLEFPSEDNLVYSFWMHMGDKDHFYDPDAVPEGERLPLKGALSDLGETTDGKTYFRDIQVPPEMLEPYDVAVSREFNSIPADNDARSRIYILYKCIHEILFSAGTGQGEDGIGVSPATLDEYIDLVGRKNPVAWTNPYTGQPMEEVLWTSVPTCYRMELPSDPGNHGKFVFDSGLTAEELAGNYSFTTADGPGSESELYSYVQFYFYMPDDSVAAYIGYGKTP